MTDHCKNCRFWERVAGKQETAIGEFGECHRFPPTPAKFPRINAEQWCGEWRRRWEQESIERN